MLVAAGVLMGARVGLASSGMRVGVGVARIGGIPTDGTTEVAVLGASLVEAVASALGNGETVGVLRLSGVRSGRDAILGRAVGVGVLVATATGAMGASTATGTISGSMGSAPLSRSAASAACGFGGGIRGIVPISQA
jgi:hypothetical protein